MLNAFKSFDLINSLFHCAVVISLQMDFFHCNKLSSRVVDGRKNFSKSTLSFERRFVSIVTNCYLVKSYLPILNPLCQAKLTFLAVICIGALCIGVLTSPINP